MIVYLDSCPCHLFLCFLEIAYSRYFNKWINIKKSYCDHSGTFAKGLRDLLNIYKLEHIVSTSLLVSLSFVLPVSFFFYFFFVWLFRDVFIVG